MEYAEIISNHLQNHYGAIFYHNGKFELITNIKENPSNILTLNRKEFEFIYTSKLYNITLSEMFCYIPEVGLGYYIYNSNSDMDYILREYELENEYKNRNKIMNHWTDID